MIDAKTQAGVEAVLVNIDTFWTRTLATSATESDPAVGGIVDDEWLAYRVIVNANALATDIELIVIRGRLTARIQGEVRNAVGVVVFAIETSRRRKRVRFIAISPPFTARIHRIIGPSVFVIVLTVQTCRQGDLVDDDFKVLAGARRSVYEDVIITAQRVLYSDLVGCDLITRFFTRTSDFRVRIETAPADVKGGLQSVVGQIRPDHKGFDLLAYPIKENDFRGSAPTAGSFGDIFAPARVSTNHTPWLDFDHLVSTPTGAAF
jgi:hypothetical protein